jgi:hypothetical protein
MSYELDQSSPSIHAPIICTISEASSCWLAFIDWSAAPRSRSWILSPVTGASVYSIFFVFSQIFTSYAHAQFQSSLQIKQQPVDCTQE